MGFEAATLLAAKKSLETMERGRAPNASNRLGQWDLFGAGLHAVLGVPTVVHTTDAQQRLHAFILKDFARWVLVEEQRLVDRVRTQKSVVTIGRSLFFVELGTCF